jgi:hypothetical protein
MLPARSPNVCGPTYERQLVSLSQRGINPWHIRQCRALVPPQPSLIVANDEPMYVVQGAARRQVLN